MPCDFRDTALASRHGVLDVAESSRTGRWAVLLLAGMVGGTAPAAAEQRDRTRGDRPTGQDARAHRGSGGWRVELFGRGGAHVLAASLRMEMSLSGFEFGEPPISFSAGDSESAWNYLGAGGVRLARGRSGVEVAWTFAPNPLLTPAVADAGPFGAFELAEPGGRYRGEDRYESDDGYEPDDRADSRAGLLVIQAFHEAPVFGPDIRLFVGLGGGWLRVRDEGSDRLMATGDGPFGIFALARQGFPGEPPPIETDFRLTQARDRALIGGSVGVTLTAGNLIVRPRADIYWSGALLSDTVLTIADPATSMSGSMTISERVRPAFFLFSVDFGFAFRR